MEDLISIMVENENTVVSGRYFAGLWKCFLYPIICFFLAFVFSELGLFFIILAALAAFGGFIAAMWFLHADAVNLKETHGLDKRAWPYWISLYFIGIFSLLIYYWTRSGLLRRAGLVEEDLTWTDRLLPYGKYKKQSKESKGGLMFKCNLCNATFSQSKGADGCPECYSSDILEV